MIRGLFITGTDTAVGKTRVSCALAHRLAAQAADVRVRKPVESGCLPGAAGPLPQDAHALRQAAGSREPLDDICRIRLRAPLSPERAAALEGVDLDLGGLHRACMAGLGPDSLLLVEGAGGFYSPVARGALNADLAGGLGLPVLLVAADRLGSLNHTLMAVEAIRLRGLALAGVVLSQASPVDDPRMDNAGELARWLGAPVLRLPYGGPGGPQAWRIEGAALAPLADRLLETHDRLVPA